MLPLTVYGPSEEEEGEKEVGMEWVVKSVNKDKAEEKTKMPAETPTKPSSKLDLGSGSQETEPVYKI